MRLPQSLQQGVLLRRYKRFLADVKLPDGSVLTIHCPNTGSMKNCRQPGSTVWFTDSGDLRRKYPHTWQFIEVPGRHRVGINTALANGLVEEALAQGRIGELRGFATLRKEVPYGRERSRIDILLRYPKGPDCYIEVKNVSLADMDGHGYFPDAVTARGQKHLRELMHIRNSGHGAALVFCVQHTGVQKVSPADDIDPDYGRLLREAMGSGVAVFALGAKIDVERSTVSLDRNLPVVV